MSFLQLIIKDVMHLLIGLYGIAIVFFIVTAIYDVVEELVKLVN